MRLRSLGQVILGLWLIGMQGSAGPLPEAGLLQVHDLKSLPSGGYSALHMAADGRRALVMTDKGGLLALKITRKEGRVVKVTSGPLILLRDANGRPLAPGQTDTEGLALAPDGRFWVSTEGTARVLAYDAVSGPAQRLPRPKAFAAYPPNTAFEALARAPDGTLWLIPEAPIRPGPFPIHRWTGTGWETDQSLPRRGLWLIVDATFDDKGRLYVLERLFAGPAGFASRIRRFAIGAEGPMAEEILLTTPLGLHDNLEGLSIWRDKAGLVASMVSDDNFLKVFRQDLVEYRLPD